MSPWPLPITSINEDKVLEQLGVQLPQRGCECRRCGDIGAGPEISEAVAAHMYFESQAPTAHHARPHARAICPGHPQGFMQWAVSRRPAWSAPGVLQRDALGLPAFEDVAHWVCRARPLRENLPGVLHHRLDARPFSSRLPSSHC